MMMSRITIELPDTSTLEEIITLTRKLNGIIIEVEHHSTTNSPFVYLKKIAEKGGTQSISDASKWQKDLRTEKELYNRE